MPTIRFITHDDQEHIVQVDSGTNIMLAAVENGVGGIVGTCGGSAVCGTCHCYIDERWSPKLDDIEEVEHYVLEGVSNLADNSRLGCQVTIDEGVDGIVVRLPATQF